MSFWTFGKSNNSPEYAGLDKFNQSPHTFGGSITPLTGGGGGGNTSSRKMEKCVIPCPKSTKLEVIWWIYKI